MTVAAMASKILIVTVQKEKKYILHVSAKDGFIHKSGKECLLGPQKSPYEHGGMASW